MRGSKPSFLGGFVLVFVACNAILGNESEYTLEPNATCLLPSQCPPGQVCLFKTCSPPCLADSDCPQEGARCLKTGNGAACVTSSSATCDAANDCPKDTVCKDGVCRASCDGDRRCFADQRCLGSVCIGTDPKRDPEANPGAAGAGAGGAAGGAAEVGGAAGAIATSGGRPTATGGSSTTGGVASGGSSAAGAAGEAGSAGAGGCVATGPENCFNGADDDCNGQTDCADSACSAPAMCVPAPAGAFMGTLLQMGSTCPSGYSPFTLRRGLMASYVCEGCSCTPESSRCESGVYGHGTNACPGPYSGVLSNVFSTSCNALPNDPNLYYFGVRGFALCTASGTPTLPPTSWQETRTFCQADEMGGGCAAGERCVPKITASLCARVAGVSSCGGDYSVETGETWYTRVDDKRSCTECSCAFGNPSCAGAVIRAWATFDCSGPETAVLGDGTQGETCGLPFVPRSGRVIGDPGAASCDPNNFVAGMALEADPQTVCCAD